MPRIPSIRAFVWVLGAFVVLAAAAATPAEARTTDARLLRTYQPVLVFHPNELFRPTKVQSFVEDSELERFFGTSPTQLVNDAFWTVVDPDPEPGELPAPAPNAVYRLDQIDCEADSALAGIGCYGDAWAEGSGGSAIYGRVVRTGAQTVLQYWLFYYDNPLILPPVPNVGTFWQSHEGDWEVVNVILGPSEQPLQAAYSQHCSGLRRNWADVGKSSEESTHPVVYVARGSHANYFAPGVGPLGVVPINPACLPASLPPLPFSIVDQVLAGAAVGPPGSGFEAATIHTIEGKTWSVFGGRWGESEYFFTPIAFPPVPAGTAVPVGLAPASPANQANWNVQTVLNWPMP